jgi:hypothetical protein
MLMRVMVGFRLMPVVFAGCLRVTRRLRMAGAVHGPPPPGPVGNPLPGLIFPTVYANENQHDDREDDDHEYPGTGEVMTRPSDERETGQHWRPPTV